MHFPIARASVLAMSVALIVVGCAELAGPPDPGRVIASGIAKYLHLEPPDPEAMSAVSAIPPPGAVRYRRLLMQAWQYHFGLAEDPAIGFGQVHQESRFECGALSPKGSAGCAQFMPATAEWINSLIPKEVQKTCSSRSGCPMDPQWALTALVEYDWRLWGSHRWAANNRERWAFSLAAYNGGSAVSTGERAACGNSPRCNPTHYFDHVELFCGATGRSPVACRENRQYPHIILDQWAPAYRAWLRS